MKITKFKRALSVLLVAVMIISTLPLNAMGLDEMERSTRPADSTNNIFEDLFWELIKPFIKPKVTVKGLPENAEGGIKIVTDPFSSKAKSSLGTFLDFYDIKAKDKTTGEIVHPEGEVEVTIKDARIKQNQSVFLIHVLDDENVIKNADNVTLITEAAFVSAFKNAAKAAENALGVSGAVAVEYINDLQISGRDITFKTSSFSIYVVTEDPRLKVNFYNGDKNESNLIVSILVTKSNTLSSSYETVLYDPGVELENSTDRIFRGWIGADPGNAYTAEDADNALTIADVRDLVAQKLAGNITDLEEIDFFAMMFRRFMVTYLDKAGVVALGRDFVLTRESDNATVNGVDYQINMNYVPDTQDEDFKGWYPISDESGYPDNIAHIMGNYDPEYQEDEKPDSTVSYTEGYSNQIYVNPSWIKIKGDLYLKAYSPSGYWLSFEENGKGASYTPPQFIESAESVPTVTVRPTDPTRLGWDFVNWYEPEYETVIIDGNEVTQPKKDDNGNVILSNTPFTFGTKLTKRTTVYAKWTPHTTANYTVIVWKERMTDTYAQNGGTGEGKEKNYDFAESFTLNGNTGDIISTVVRSTNSYVTDGDQDGTRYYNAVVDGTTISGKRAKADYTGFHCASIEENVVIVPEGTSVVNVYYDRNTVTYTFYTYTDNGGYVVATDENGTQYGLVNGEYVELTKENRPVTVWTPVYTYTRVPATNNDGTQYALIDGEYVELRKETEQTTTYRWRFSRSTIFGTNTYWMDESSEDGIFYIRNGNNNYTASGYTNDNPPPVNNGVTYYAYYSSYWDSDYYQLTPISTTVTTYTWYNGDEIFDGNRYTRTTGGSEYSGKRYLLEDGTYTETTGEDGTQYYVDPYGGHVQLNKGTATRTVWVIPQYEANYVVDNTNGEYALVDGEYVKLDPVYEYTYLPTGYTYTQNNSSTTGELYGVVNGSIQRVYRANNGNWYTSQNYNTRYRGSRYTRSSTTNNTAYTGDLYTLIDGTAGTGNSGFTTGGSENLYGKGNGDVYFQLETTATVVGYTLNGETYTGTGDRYTVTYEETGETEIYYGPRYKKTTGSGWHIYQANIGLYGETLPWPEDSSIWWYEGQNSNTRMTYKANFLPLTDDMTVEYWGRAGNGTSQIIFYTQDLNNTQSYTAQVTVSSSNGSFSINDKFTGFYAYQYRVDNGSWQNVGTLNSGTGIYGSAIDYNSKLEIRYNRITGTITFMDGKYFNGNGVGTDEVPKGDPFKTSQTYYYEADVSTYNKEGADYYTPPVYHEGYVFAGWYADDACTHEYDFTTMPAGGITVYAKWVQKQYRVFLHPGVPTSDTSLEWGDNTQPMTFRVDYGTKISGGQMIVGERDLYEIVGWYYDPDFKKPFNFDAYVLNDNTVRDDYDKDAVDTDYMGRHGVIGWWDETDIQNYPDDLTGVELGSHTNKDKTKNRFWINKQLNLYAKWKHKIVGADGVYLVYDAGEGTFIGGGTTYSDGILYDDAAHTYGIAASVAPEGKFFRYWSVQKWEDGQYKDTGDVVYPGELFHIDYTLAKPVSVTDELHPEHTFDYFMRLVAVYTEAEAPVVDVKYDRNATDAVWSIGSEVEAYKDNNNESVYYKKYTDDQYGFAIEINKEFSILKNENYLTRTGYKFLGWAFDKNMTAETFKSTLATETAQGSGNRTVFAGGEDGVAADDLDNPNSSINTLYAIWLPLYDVEFEKDIDNSGLTVDNTETFTVTYTVTYPEGVTIEGASSKTGTLTISAGQDPLPKIEGIPEGSTVTYTETVGDNFTSNNATGTITGINENKTKANGNKQVAITNKRETTTVTITKTVSSVFDADKQLEFEFTVSAQLADGRTVGLLTSQVPTNGKFTLKHGEHLDVTVPVGATVTVNENAVTGFTTTSTPANGTLTAAPTGPNQITYTNTRQTAEVDVTKAVVGSANDKNTSFSFTAEATLDGNELSSAYVINNSFTLKDGDKKTVTVPLGAKVTVTEAAASGFVTEVGGVETNKYETAVLTADGDGVTFTNTRLIDVKVKKDLDNKGVSDGWNSFNYPINVSVNGTALAESYTIKGSGAETTVPGIKYGSTITVTENDEASLTEGGDKIKDVFTVTNPAANINVDENTATIVVKNVRKTYTVTVTKTALNFAPGKTFNFTAEGLPEASFALGNGGSKEFTEIPFGTEIKVKEADGGAEYIGARTVNGAVDPGENGFIVVKANVTIAYDNTIQYYPVVVTKNVESIDPDDKDPSKKTFTITVSYTMPNGTTGSVEMNLGNGQKNTDAGIDKPISLPYGTTYEVTETQETNFKTPVISPASGTVTGATNVSVKNERETVEIIIDKDVTYSGDQSTSFIFDVTAPGVSRTEAGGNAVTATHGTNSETITVPKGSSVTITEKNPLPDSTVTSTAGSVTGNATITFTANGNTTVKYVNKRNPLTIKVTKVLKTNDAFTVTDDSTMTFPVHIVYIKDDGTESDETYNLKAGGSKEFNDVQYGSTLLVEETLTGALATQFKTPVISNYATTVTADQENITVTNERDTSTITVTKTVTNEAAAADFADTGFVITPEITGVTLNPASLTLKHGNEKEIIVPKGFTLKLTETVVDKFTPSYKVGSAATATSGNVVSSISTDSDEKVEFINHRDPVKATVNKIFTGTVAGDDALTFPVVVTYVDDTTGAKEVTYDLAGGDSATIENVAYGSAVTVTETVDTNLFKDPVIESNIEKITEDGTITVTNERKTATITVKKTVVGPDAQFAFTATAKLGDKAVTLSDDDASFTLGNNGTKTITVPAGSIVTVTEGDYTANYFTDVNGTKDTREFISGVLVADTNTEVTFTNTRKVKVTVKKSVSATDAELVGNDTFTVAVSGDGVARLADSDKNFSLTKDGSKVITVIYGKAFTVTETIAETLTWKYKTPEYAGDTNVTGTGNTFTATADGTVTITNTLKEYQVTVKKTGTSTYPANHPFKFNVEGFTGVGITDGVTEIMLGGSKTWTVKAGSKIDVTEQSDDYTASSTRSVTGSDIVDGKIFIKADTTITFDNTIKTQKVKIKKVIDNSELGEAFRSVADQNATEFSITYVVKDANGKTVETVSTTITKGTDITVEGVPYGGKVEVTEDAQTLFEVSYTNNGATVTDDSTVITITNKRKATSLTINKTVESSVDADKAATYNFTVTVDGVTTPVSAAVTAANGTGSTTLEGLPLGAKVTVKETVPQYMEVDHNDQVINELAATGNELNFKNTRPNIEIPVEKIVKSRVEADYDKDYTFSYEYTVDHEYKGTATISIVAKPADADTMNGTTTVTVPKGATAFKLTEDTVDANLTVTYSNNEIAGPITTSPAKVTVTNERPEIPVTIEKVVVSDINDYSNYDFKFDYTVKFGSEPIETGTKTITGVGTNSEIKVPKGADITVTEQTGVRYTTINNADFTVAQVFDTTYSNGMEAANTLTGVVAEGGKITVTNTRKLVEVTVKKVVNNKWNIASDLTKEFSFKFDSAKMYTGADATVITNADTKKLKHDGEIKIKVPFGATFTATETEDPAFDTKVRTNSEADAEALTATTDPLTVDGTVITFTNTRKPIKVTVRKHVNKHFDEDINETFHFEAAVKFGDNAWALPTADRAFDLMDWKTDNSREHVFEVPYGSNIQVKEVNHTGFTSSATINNAVYDQNMTSTPLTQDATVIIYNDRDYVTISVTKTVKTDDKLKNVDEAIEFPFTYSWKKDENFKREATPFTLKHGQEAYTFTVPVGAAVNVNELTDTELTVYNNLKISDVFATVSEYGTTTDDQTVSFNANAATTVAFTNTHKNVNVNLVKAVNLEQDKNVDFEFTWSAVYGTDVDFTTNNGKATRNHNTTATLLCTVPVGVKISVTEILPSEQGFVTPNIVYTTGVAGTVDGAVVTISDIKADATITYTNSRQVFDITFGKKVVNGVANDNEFPFRFTYTDNGEEEHEVFISDNGSITIPKVPYGHTIVITEDVLNQLSAYGNFKVADIFTTTVSGQSANCTVDGAKVTITVKNNENITFTNTHKTSTVTITKTVESKNESDKQHEFPFNATAHAGDAYVIGSADEKDSFVLKHNGTKVYTVPYGFEFTVGEEPDTRYNTSIKFDGTSEAAQVKSFTVAKDAYTIAYLNERAQGDLKIVKTGVGETTDAFLFKVTKNNDETFKPLFVTIHGNGSVYVMQLEAGDYKVEEVTDWSWRYDKQTEEITNEAEGAVKTDDMATIMGGESGDKAPTVTFTNKKNNKNWLGTECGSDNKYDPQLTAAVDPAAEQVAWDSKIRLAYASPADKFCDNKETA